MRSVFIQKDKEIFKVDELPAEEYAASMGLPGAPQIKFSGGKGKVKVRGGDKRVEKVEDVIADLPRVVGSDEESEGEDISDSDQEPLSARDIGGSDDEAGDEEIEGSSEGSEAESSTSARKKVRLSEYLCSMLTFAAHKHCCTDQIRSDVRTYESVHPYATLHCSHRQRHRRR
jgi:ATP-dependent RNA helicase DDX10/DBP4